MIRALIADDEPLARRGIAQLLAAHPDVTIAGECRDGRETLRALDTVAPDLVFLDVQMPELDGFDVLRARGPARMPAVVFVTAYDAFAVRAFETYALDYLVKPVTARRFAAAMERVRDRLRSDEAVRFTRQLAALLSAQGGAAPAWPPDAAPPVPRGLVIPSLAGDLVLDADEIDWIQAEDYYAAVYARGRRHLIRESLASLAERLDPARFIRVHRSAVVRLDRVRELRVAESVLVLRDGTRVPVSRRRREAVGALLRARFGDRG